MAAPKGCYFGKLLDVDLTSGKISVKTLDEEIYKTYLGGIGLGAYLLYSELPAKIDPLSPQNMLCVLTGPLNGTACPACRLNVSFKSPLTGIYGHTQVGGPMGNEVKWCGWDGIIFRGKSPKPVYLHVVDDKAELKDASKLWGKDTYTTDEMLKDELKDKDLKTLVIGPAGENGVLFSAMIVDRFRAAARSGGGAVMGSKNLKAIAVHGTRGVPLVNVEAFNKAAKQATEAARTQEAWDGIKRMGTAVLIENANFNAGTLVTRNYQTSWFPDVGRIGAEEAYRTFWKRNVSCPNCPVHCMKVGVLRNTNFDGLIAEGPEYETGTLFGSNVAVSDFDFMMKAVEYCDAMGMDTISAGVVCGYTMELVDRGILDPDKDLDRIDMRWGNGQAVLQALEAIAFKKGKAGELLGMGTKRMGEKIGGDAPKYAMQVKGQEMAAHEPRGFKGRGVSYALGPRGGCHHEGNNPQGQSLWTMIGSTVMCTFIGGVPLNKAKINPQVICDMLNAGAGWNWTPDTYWTTAKRLITLQRCYNYREAGITRKDDRLPERFKEPLPEGPKKGQTFSEEDTKKMQDEYYAYYGWDDDGIPTEATLTQLGLGYAIKDIKKK
ncbi:MAG: aldehyde ferredoxin oxidoreductase family protein [Desulfovibrio sp.]|jgi:aldehyde:ferredoxin oxidoreductase|nr:aldehyde ferredoxin oxidoreductase family protein [Desulfovibrio sp.]